MERIVLRHLSGSKANQVEEFPLSHFNELVIGRDPSSTVKYDPDRDDLVGRQHAKVTRDTSNPNEFLITDLGSRNGTFVNKQRIVGTAKIRPGDVVQFGPGGPEFQFDIEPRPADLARPTRVADVPATVSTAPPTRVASGGTAPYAQAQASHPVPGTQVGKATVERMIGQSKAESRTWLILGGGALVVLVIAVAAYILIKQPWTTPIAEMEKQRQEEDARRSAAGPRAPTDIAAMVTPATVYIQMSWKLTYTPTGGQIYHQMVPNVYTDKDGENHQIVPNGPRLLAAYVVVGQNKIEPALGLDQNTGIPITAAGTGTGFVVTSDGFIITNRHVASNWRHPYRAWSRNALPGVYVGSDGRPMLNNEGRPYVLSRSEDLPWGWIPSESKQGGSKFLGEPKLEGRLDYLYVTLAKTEVRHNASLKTASDRHDVALIKVDVPESLTKLELNDNYDTIKPGEQALVLGYPGSAPQLYGVIGSKEAGGAFQEAQMGVIPNPTLSVGYIASIIRGQEGTAGKDAILSVYGDIYQMTINSTGGGNSGGPVLDDRGRVIAIYTYGLGQDFQASGAVPIRYAKELMSPTQVIK